MFSLTLRATRTTNRVGQPTLRDTAWLVCHRTQGSAVAGPFEGGTALALPSRLPICLPGNIASANPIRKTGAQALS